MEPTSAYSNADPPDLIRPPTPTPRASPSAREGHQQRLSPTPERPLATRQLTTTARQIPLPIPEISHLQPLSTPADVRALEMDHNYRHRLPASAAPPAVPLPALLPPTLQSTRTPPSNIRCTIDSSRIRPTPRSPPPPRLNLRHRHIGPLRLRAPLTPNLPIITTIRRQDQTVMNYPPQSVQTCQQVRPIQNPSALLAQNNQEGQGNLSRFPQTTQQTTIPIQQNQQSHEPTDNSTSSSTPPGQPQRTELTPHQKLHIFRLQLQQMLHASKCARRERQNPSSAPCPTLWCLGMRQSMNHARNCRIAAATGIGVACNDRRCLIYRQIISHWEVCRTPHCTLCAPIKLALAKAKMAQLGNLVKTKTVDTASAPAPVDDNSPCTSATALLRRAAPPPPPSPQPPPDWRPSISKESRVQLIRNVANLLAPVVDHDNELVRAKTAWRYAHQLEGIAFTRAHSPNHYNHAVGSRALYELEKLINARNERQALSAQTLAQAQVPKIEEEVEEQKVEIEEVHELPEQQAEPSQEPVQENEYWTKILMPSLEEMLNDPESLPFRQPVDPEALNLPDYTDKIKNPMDLSTIRSKLESGAYKGDPWAYIDDVGLMIDNALKYNRKFSRIYKNANRMAAIFDPSIDPIMRKLGYCCGFRYKLKEVVIPGSGSSKPDPVPEPFVTCVVCSRKFHQICELYLEANWPQGFTCRDCRISSNIPAPVNKFTTDILPPSSISTFIEDRVNKFLNEAVKTENSSDAIAVPSPVAIRLLSSATRRAHVADGAKRRFVDSGAMPEAFPYRAKVLCAFQQFDGVQVCFFAMQVQEYGAECPQPNARRVYVAYLDSVHFFQPARLRTALYHEILIGYLEYVKRRGFNVAHIWACPPAQDQDYIFHCHPPEQKMPTFKKLQDWYREMLDKGIRDGTVVEYKSSIKLILSAPPERLPYFEGDLWPKMLEDCIKELETAKAKELNPPAAKKAKKSASSSGRSKARSKSRWSKSPAKSQPSQPLDLASKLRTHMETFKNDEVFFVVQLHSEESTISTEDPDPLMSLDVVDSREEFLGLAMDNRWEFSTLRKAKWSTIGLIHHVYSVQQLPDIFSCNLCSGKIELHEIRFHCEGGCDDFDICVECYEKEGHSHQVKKIDPESSTPPPQPEATEATGEGHEDEAEVDVSCKNSKGSGEIPPEVSEPSPPPRDSSPPSEPQAPQTQPSSEFQQPQAEPQPSSSLVIFPQILQALRALIHASECSGCSSERCAKMMNLLLHTKECVQFNQPSGCPACDQVLRLCRVHTDRCTRPNCHTIFCALLKFKSRAQPQQLTEVTPGCHPSPLLSRLLQAPPTPTIPATANSAPDHRPHAQAQTHPPTGSSTLAPSSSRVSRCLGDLVQTLPPRQHALTALLTPEAIAAGHGPRSPSQMPMLLSALSVPQTGPQQQRVVEILRAHPNLLTEFIRRPSVNSTGGAQHQHV